MIKFILFFLCYAIQTASCQLVINEIVSDNKSLLFDYEGKSPDVIELYNTSSSSIQLADYFLSDDEDEPDKWQFPNLSLGSNQFIIVFASGKPSDGNELHANFKIASDGEPIFLSKAGVLIDEFPKISLTIDQAFGRINDGIDELGILVIPSLGTSNNNNNLLQFSHESGFYLDSILLDVSVENTSHEIRYTVNGNIPTNESSLWQGQTTLKSRVGDPNNYANIKTSPGFYIPTVEVYKIHTLRFSTFSNGVPSSPIYERTFIIDQNFNHDRFSYPTFSIVTDSNNFFNYDTGIYVPGVHFNSSNKVWTGNYFQRGEEWERDVHITMFGQDQSILLNQNAGVRIHGGRKRYSKVKTLRLYARDEYGDDHFRTSLFPTGDKTKYRRFLLRNPHGCWNKTVIKDALSHFIVSDFNMETQRAQPAVIFVNGEYWGMNTIRDFIDNNYLSEKYQLDKDSLDILLSSASHIAEQGSDSDYVAILNFMEQNDISRPSNYAHVQSKIEISSFIDYQIAEIFLNNYDWPAGNNKYWKSQQPDGKWRWIFYDLDAGWGNRGASFNMLEFATATNSTQYQNPPEATFLLRTLLTNQTFKLDFLSRFSCLLNTRFMPDTLMDFVDYFQDWYEPGISELATRWNVPTSSSSWNGAVSGYLKSFAISRRNYMITHIQNYFDLPNYNPADYCNTNAVADNFKMQTNIAVYPNPFSEVVHVSVPARGIINHSLTDGLGRIIASTDNANWTLNTSELSPGIYFLKSVINNDLQVKKIVKQ
jgi:hypothetical protein